MIAEHERWTRVLRRGHVDAEHHVHQLAWHGATRTIGDQIEAGLELGLDALPEILEDRRRVDERNGPASSDALHRAPGAVRSEVRHAVVEQQRAHARAFERDDDLVERPRVRRLVEPRIGTGAAGRVGGNRRRAGELVPQRRLDPVLARRAPPAVQLVELEGLEHAPPAEGALPPRRHAGGWCLRTLDARRALVVLRVGDHDEVRLEGEHARQNAASGLRLAPDDAEVDHLDRARRQGFTEQVREARDPGLLARHVDPDGPRVSERDHPQRAGRLARRQLRGAQAERVGAQGPHRPAPRPRRQGRKQLVEHRADLREVADRAEQVDVGARRIGPGPQPELGIVVQHRGLLDPRRDCPVDALVDQRRALRPPEGVRVGGAYGELRARDQSCREKADDQDGARRAHRFSRCRHRRRASVPATSAEFNP